VEELSTEEYDEPVVKMPAAPARYPRTFEPGTFRAKNASHLLVRNFDIQEILSDHLLVSSRRHHQNKPEKQAEMAGSIRTRIIFLIHRFCQLRFIWSTTVR
jgi:hypothetical protein